MIDIYQTWVDGLRHRRLPDRHDEARQRRVLAAVRAAMQAIAAHDGNPDFFMFGEVALDGSDAGAKSFTSHYTTHDKMQAILDFPFQDAARGFASKGLGNQQLARFFANDDWYTDRDSNVYELPTFLGNHDMGRIGQLPQGRQRRSRPTPSCSPATGWRTSSCTSRAATRSSTTATSRASPAPAATSSPGRRCSRARCRSTSRRRPDRHRPHAGPGQLRHRATRCTSRSRRSPPSPRSDPALRNGAEQVPLRLERPGRLRVLADRPRAPEGVRRRAQQQRVGGVGQRADVPRARATSPRCTAPGRPV